MRSALHIDLYQLSSLLVHHHAGKASMPVTMSFFSRRLPRREDGSGQSARGFLLQAALGRCLEWLSEVRFDEAQLASLDRQPVVGPRLDPELRRRLAEWRFEGIIDAPLDGTPLFAGTALGPDGKPVDFGGVCPSAACPYLVVQTDLLSAKLIETPLLSLLNHMTMVASKAAAVVEAAGGRPVYEFGTRRTHPDAAVDAALAAWIGGCSGSSNVEAFHRYGVPCVGTMDHFAVQAWEQAGVPRATTEHAFFKAFYDTFAGGMLLVDTYDSFGEQTGIRNAVAATEGKLGGVRIDSGISKETVWKARKLLDALGAPQAKILLSGGLDEAAMQELAGAPVDAYGVGERIVTSPDAPVGVGAVAKLCEVGKNPTMKLSRGSGKATLPGRVQVFRGENGDTVAMKGEYPPGRPLLERVWEHRSPCLSADPGAARERAQRELAALPAEWKRPRQATLQLSPRLYALVAELATAK